MDTTAAPATISRPSRIAIALAIGAAALLGAACSSAAEVTPTATTSDQTTQVDATAPATESAPVADDASTATIDCEALHRARIGIQGTGGNLIYAEDAEFVTVLIGGPDAVAKLQADVEALRPYQDVDAVPFGPIREGLDNFENDLTAATEGRFADITGGYKAAGINGLMAELGC